MEESLNALGFSNGADEAQGQVVDAPEMVESADVNAGAVTPPPTAETLEGELEEKKPQSREFNNAMKQARLAGKREAEEELKREYNQRVAAYQVTNPNTGQPFGSFDEFLAYGEAIQANNMGIPVEQLRAMREAADKQRQTEDELSAVKGELALAKVGEDLAELKKTFPEIKADSVFELGADFMRMCAAGVSPVAAYLATKEAKAATTKPAPPSMGGLSKEAAEKEYYTSEELDALSPEQLDKPGVLDRAIKSLSRIGK